MKTSHLTLEQRLARYGLTVADLQYNKLMVGGSQEQRFCHCPCKSTLKPIMLKTYDIDKVKEWIGNTNADFESGQLQPAQYERLSVREGRHLPVQFAVNRLFREHLELLSDVARAYVYGYSLRYERYRDAINQHLGPFQVALLAGNELTIEAGKPLVFTGPGPCAADFDTVTFKGKNAQIVSYTNLKFTTRTLVMQA